MPRHLDRNCLKYTLPDDDRILLRNRSMDPTTIYTADLEPTKEYRVHFSDLVAALPSNCLAYKKEMSPAGVPYHQTLIDIYDLDKDHELMVTLQSTAEKKWSSWMSVC